MSLFKELDNEKNNVLKDIDNPRSASPNNSHLRSHSRGRPHDSENRSLSRARRTANGIKWTILNHDPSERLSIGNHNSLENEDDDNFDSDYEEEDSEEEQISDTDNEFQYDDGGVILPNFATYRKEPIEEAEHEQEKSKKEKISDAGLALETVTSRLRSYSMGETNEDPVVKDAKEVARLQEIQATQSALENAVAVGAPIPKETIDIIKNLPPKELEYIDQSLLERQPAAALPDDDEGCPAHSSKSVKKVSDLYLKKYANYKGKITSPGDKRNFNAPYTYDREVEEDVEVAKKLNAQINIGDIDSSIENSRCIRTITRGNFFESLSIHNKPNTYLICTDFSPESLYALEWCIGTVLCNNSVLFIIYVIEEDKEKSKMGNNVTDIEKEQIRKDGIERITKTYLDFIKLTKLQIHAVVEVIHHPIPRHLITEVIDHIQPTLVVVGSRGKNAIQGVLLGSLSNYLVTKSSVPVMVVRKELKKTLKKKKFSNYSSNVHSLKDARVD
ncbi:hypothetical protein DASC09_049900 [Saccharomycopsis crataegensis]|uniref:UspA domain-containing protein n=1 Tax=Saccharomycopsis crataegensis TaxID=43959 RepID=A0AAV5QST6_9ASCO|nr:hypothetical protein DASC09_049900 [Saccharomycopsis crataegensis]